MAARGRLKPFLLLVLLFALFRPIGAAIAAEPGAIERDLVVTVQGEERHVGLDEALTLLNVPSVSIALIDEGRIAFARAYGKDATPDTLYQAASLSKFVAAIGAMRLVENGTLKLDEDVNETLTSWKVPSKCVRLDTQGDVARAAQHDRRHRRARLPRLCSWCSASDPHTNSGRGTAGKFAAGHGDRRPGQRLSLFRRRL